MWVFGKRHGRSTREPRSIDEDDLHAVARPLPLQRGGRVVLRSDRTTIDFGHLIVLFESGCVDRPRRRDDGCDARAVARLVFHVAQPPPAGISPAKSHSCAAEQPFVVRHVASLDVLREELAREGAIAADAGERFLGVGQRVRAIDVAFARAAGPAELLPHRPHEVVERHAAVAAIAQRKIEGECDGAPERIVRDDGVRPVGAIDGSATVDERRHAAHLDGGSNAAAGIVHDRVDQAAGDGGRRGDVDQLRALHRQRSVVLREAFREPQGIGRVRAIEIERLEP